MVDSAQDRLNTAQQLQLQDEASTLHVFHLTFHKITQIHFLIPLLFTLSPFNYIMVEQPQRRKVGDIHFHPTSRDERDNSKSVYLSTIKSLK
jgi:hypothetical protein